MVKWETRSVNSNQHCIPCGFKLIGEVEEIGTIAITLFLFHFSQFLMFRFPVSGNPTNMIIHRLCAKNRLSIP